MLDARMSRVGWMLLQVQIDRFLHLDLATLGARWPPRSPRHTGGRAARGGVAGGHVMNRLWSSRGGATLNASGRCLRVLDASRIERFACPLFMGSSFIHLKS